MNQGGLAGSNTGGNAGTSNTGGSGMSGSGGGPVIVPDGEPNRLSSCVDTSSSTGITPNHQGRLDGYLVSFVPLYAQQCNGDSGHIHLQVKANSKIYDVAVNLESTQQGSSPQVQILEVDSKMPGGAWVEGWHDQAELDYAVDLGLSSTSFSAMDKETLEFKLQADLEQVNHISIYCTGYSDGSGCHNVHRQGNGRDGALVTQPLSTPSHFTAFRFATQTF